MPPRPAGAAGLGAAPAAALAPVALAPAPSAAPEGACWLVAAGAGAPMPGRGGSLGMPPRGPGALLLDALPSGAAELLDAGCCRGNCGRPPPRPRGGRDGIAPREG